MKIGEWQKKVSEPNYIVWSLPQKPMHNPHSIVVRTEMGDWVTFVDMGHSGTSVLNKNGTKEKNMIVAKNYMKLHPYG